MKVWLCSHGSYSDYHVTGVYSSAEDAKRITAAFGWENDPEEFELNSDIPKEARDGFLHFTVRMRADGNVEYVTNSQPYGEDEWRESFIDYRKPDIKCFFLTAQCWAKDKDHAIKIVNERRIMRLAHSAGARQDG